ncbi:hypothetical protein NQ318_012530 [Aromia moschata]|uniref:V-type proton ATPase subunit F n=1 Tax=Aromia moschata TaxID=1265417 RepID=A0AAV8XEL7_9CUCU|nr:hypothetical protein NQ318_012530 [Aromia moschata]
MGKFLYDIKEESSDSNVSLSLDSVSVQTSVVRDPILLIAIIGDEDTCVGYLLGGIGQMDDEQRPNYFIVDRKTKDVDVEAAFRKFVGRGDIGIILITADAAKKISNTLHSYNKAMPMVMEIPGKNGPYEINIDHILKRAKCYEKNVSKW